MAGIENFAAMLNNMSGDGAGRMGELFNHLTSSGAAAYAQFCNRATPDESKALAAWFSMATPEQVQQAAARLNSGKAGGPASFLAWLDALRTGKRPLEPAPTKKWWQFWKSPQPAAAPAPVGPLPGGQTPGDRRATTSSPPAAAKKSGCGHTSVSAGLAAGCVECALALRLAQEHVRRQTRE
jgi:hypothetical protein